MEQLCLDLSTGELAAQDKCKPQTIRKRLSETGSYWGVVPKKHPSGRLLWPHDAAARVLVHKTKRTGPNHQKQLPFAPVRPKPVVAPVEQLHAALGPQHCLVVDALRRKAMTPVELERATGVPSVATILDDLRRVGMEVPVRDEETQVEGQQSGPVQYALTGRDIRLAAKLLKMKGAKRG
jgi:hypothetical protein